MGHIGIDTRFTLTEYDLLLEYRADESIRQREQLPGLEFQDGISSIMRVGAIPEEYRYKHCSQANTFLDTFQRRMSRNVVFRLVWDAGESATLGINDKHVLYH